MTVCIMVLQGASLKSQRQKALQILKGLTLRINLMGAVRRRNLLGRGTVLFTSQGKTFSPRAVRFLVFRLVSKGLNYFLEKKVDL